MSYMRIMRALEKKFMAKNWKPIVLKMKSTGLFLYLTARFAPDADRDGLPTIMDVEYLEASGEASAIRFSGTVDETCRKLADYDAVHAQWMRDLEDCNELLSWYNANITGNPETDFENFCAYAEKYRSVYGHDPEGMPC